MAIEMPGDRAVLAPMVEREIVWRLLTGPLGSTVRQIGLADSSTTQISRAVRWITEHYAEPFRVDDLARSCGMSTSAFHRTFRSVTALSPIQFQKQIRLHKSRLLLMTGVDDVADGRLPGRVRQHLPVQPRIQTPIRTAARSRRRTPPR